MNWEQFGKKIREARIKKGLTQAELADILKVTSVSISYYEAGKKRPSFEKIKTLCKVLDMKMDEV